MALVCLHYSKFFREKLVNKKISGTVLKGKWKFPKDSEVFIYVTEADSVEEGKIDHKIGAARILSSNTMKVKELTENEARAEDCRNREELINEIKYWHKIGDDDIVTFLEFNLETF